jgi:hypothetical protein
MSVPITLPEPIPIEQIQSRTDRFFCEPYKVKLLAGSCVDRQDMLSTDPNRRAGDYLYCRGCACGARVRALVNAPPLAPDAPKPTHGPGVAHRGPRRVRVPLLELPASPPSEHASRPPRVAETSLVMEELAEESELQGEAFSVDRGTLETGALTAGSPCASCTR